jgi:hypothetical protein
VRATTLPTIALGSSLVGVVSNTQSVTLANTGTASISVSSIAFGGTFTTISGSCSATPITLASGASCTQNIAFVPAAIGTVAGSVTFGGSGVVAEKSLLTGSGVQATTTTTLTSSAATPFINQPITFTATVAPLGTGNAIGLVSFYDGSVLLGTGLLTANLAAFTTAALPSGTHSIPVVYAGDASLQSTHSDARRQSCNVHHVRGDGKDNGDDASHAGRQWWFGCPGIPAAAIRGTSRKGSQRMRSLVLGVLLALSPGGVMSLSGCGSDSGFFGQQQKKYTINVIATAQGAGSASLQHVATVTLTVQ